MKLIVNFNPNAWKNISDSKKISCIFVYSSMVCLGILSLWAGDWWSWKLIITIPLGIVTFFLLSIGATEDGVTITH